MINDKLRYQSHSYTIKGLQQINNSLQIGLPSNQMPDRIYRIGIRREDKSVWQRRAPLTPHHVRELLEQNPDLCITLQPSKKRVFSDHEYQQNGATIHQDLSQCDLILGIKEIPVDKFLPDKTYMFFSHTIKAQPHNMSALDRMLEERIRLIDYEKITDEKGSRLIAFGRYAGIAGAIDFLKGFGEYVMQMGISTPFLNANCSYKYFHIEEAYEHLKLIGKKIQEKSIPQELRPMIFGITGRGRTAKGCLQVLSNLPITMIKPSQVSKLCSDPTNPSHAKTIYVVNINSQDVMVPRDPTQKFDKQDYYHNPGKYINKFHQLYLPYVSAIFHCIYWDSNCPRYIKNSHLRELAEQKRLRLVGICDVSCDLNGSIECLTKYTQPEKPFFYFDSLKGEETFDNHYEYGKFVYLAIDFLPSQLAYDASVEFSTLLKQWIPHIVKTPLTDSLQDSPLIPQLKRAVITLNGKLTPDFKYIQKLREESDCLMNTMVKKEQVIKTEVGETASILSKNVSIVPVGRIKGEVLVFDNQEEGDDGEEKGKKEEGKGERGIVGSRDGGIGKEGNRSDVVGG